MYEQEFLMDSCLAGQTGLAAFFGKGVKLLIGEFLYSENELQTSQWT